MFPILRGKTILLHEMVGGEGRGGAGRGEASSTLPQIL